MTPEERQALRQAIDQRRRELNGAPADGILHGTHYAYRRLRCRCDDCRQTAAEVRRAHRHKVTAGLATVRHGRSGYGNGCRCDICREAHRAYQRARARRSQ